MRSELARCIIVAFVLLASILGWCFSVYEVATLWGRFWGHDACAGRAVLVFRVVFLVLGFVIWVDVLRSLFLTGFRPFIKSFDWFSVRVSFYALLPPLILTSLLHGFGAFDGHRFLMSSFFFTTLFLGLCLWAFWILRLRGIKKRNKQRLKIMRWIDVFAMNTLILLVLAEGSLILWSRLAPSLLFWDESSLASHIEAHRLRPGQPYFNFRMNSQGYHDEEFFRAGPTDLVVALLADSFGLGVVPYAYNFATVAESKLHEEYQGCFTRVAVHNFGIPGAGPMDYAYLMKTDVEVTNPQIVVLAIFVGNDIHESRDFGRRLRPPSRYCFQNWFLFRLPRKLFIMKSEAAGPANLTDIGTTDPSTSRIPAYISNPSLEPPTFTRNKFMDIERKRLEICNTSSPLMEKYYRDYFNMLKFFHSQLGNRLLVLLIPDEFQVNDSLYNELVSTLDTPSVYQREYPQERTSAFCRDNGIAFMDALPTLREAEKKKRTYHLQDAHLNSNGNRVLGLNLASALSAMILRLQNVKRLHGPEN